MENMAENGEHADVVFMDPPRIGTDAFLISMKPSFSFGIYILLVFVFVLIFRLFLKFFRQKTNIFTMVCKTEHIYRLYFSHIIAMFCQILQISCQCLWIHPVQAVIKSLCPLLSN